MNDTDMRRRASAVHASPRKFGWSFLETQAETFQTGRSGYRDDNFLLLKQSKLSRPVNTAETQSSKCELDPNRDELKKTKEGNACGL